MLRQHFTVPFESGQSETLRRPQKRGKLRQNSSIRRFFVPKVPSRASNSVKRRMRDYNAGPNNSAAVNESRNDARKLKDDFQITAKGCLEWPTRLIKAQKIEYSVGNRGSVTTQERRDHRKSQRGCGEAEPRRGTVVSGILSSRISTNCIRGRRRNSPSATSHLPDPICLLLWRSTVGLTTKGASVPQPGVGCLGKPQASSQE